MSTKTVTKRVALATVVALGAGVLSLVSVTSSSAATLNTQANNTLAGGITIETSTPTVGATPSTGLLSSSLTTVGTASTPDVLAATVLTTGVLNFRAGTNVTTGYGGYYTVSAGGYFSGDSNTVANLNGGQTTDSSTAIGGVGRIISVGFTGAAGSTVTINGYDSSAKGTTLTTLIVTLAAASVSGTASTSKSNIYWAGAPQLSQALTSDLSTGSATTTGLPLYLQIDLNDAYGAALTSTSGALTVTASTGANVGLGGGASITSGTYSTAVSAAAPGDIIAKITEATAGAGWSGTVTVSYNGVVLATKSGTITGVPAKITIAPLVVGQINATVDTAISYQVYDAAGNAVVLPSSSIALTSSSNTASVINIGAGTFNNTNSTTSAGTLSVVGGTTAGTSNVVVQTTLSSGAVVTSNSISVPVGNTAASYTATLDKSKYAPGDIATLKVKFLDSKGNIASSKSSLFTESTVNSVTSWNAGITVPQLTLIGSYPALTSAATYGLSGNIAADATGVLTFKYTVGTSTGAFNAVVDFPTVDGVAGSAQAIAYSVTDGATSLNDVLKGIVSLIASINKQIAALAKLVAPAKKK